jgi:hypothetical protein
VVLVGLVRAQKFGECKLELLLCACAAAANVAGSLTGNIMARVGPGYCPDAASLSPASEPSTSGKSVSCPRLPSRRLQPWLLQQD